MTNVNICRKLNVGIKKQIVHLLKRHDALQSSMSLHYTNILRFFPSV